MFRVVGNAHIGTVIFSLFFLQAVPLSPSIIFAVMGGGRFLRHHQRVHSLWVGGASCLRWS